MQISNEMVILKKTLFEMVLKEVCSMTQSKILEEDREQAFHKSVAEKYFKIRESLFINDFKPRSERLYHYTSPEGLIGILNSENFVLRFSRFDCLNDVTEGILAYKLFNEVIAELKNENLISDQLYELAAQIKPEDGDFYIIKLAKAEKVRTETEKDENGLFWLNEDKYLCCFSEEPDSLPMWNYYTKGISARGYNIGISKSSLQKRKHVYKGNELRIVKILYKQETQKELIKKMMMEIQNEFSILGEQLANTLMTEVLIEWRFLFKSECFAHEKEVRAILTVPTSLPEETKDVDAFKVRFRNNSGYVIPFIELKFSKRSAQIITVGPLLDYSSAVNGLKALLSDGKYEWVDIVKTQIPNRY